MQPDISVILPFYNAAHTLNNAIRSIANQTYDNFECILINNNSTDGSKDIAKAWEKNDSRFRLVEESKQGVVFASNKGSALACGRYIARMDADDWAYPERLELQSQFLDQHPSYEAVVGLARYENQTGNRTGFQNYVDWVNSLKTYKEIKAGRFIDSPIVNPTAMWRRITGEIFGLYRDGDFPEDYEMWLRWLSQGVKIAKINRFVIKWMDSENRLTRTHPIYSDEAFYRVKTFYLSKWLKNNNPHHPFISVWGASKISRKRAALLEKYGIKINFYIDTKRTRQLEKKVLYYKDIPTAGEVFILVYVRQWHAKEDIKQFLNEKSYIEGKNYLMIS